MIAIAAPTQKPAFPVFAALCHGMAGGNANGLG